MPGKGSARETDILAYSKPEKVGAQGYTSGFWIGFANAHAVF
jgi:hypothetical protein